MRTAGRSGQRLAAARRRSRRCGVVRAVFLALACLLPTPATLQDAASRETAEAAPRPARVVDPACSFPGGSERALGVGFQQHDGRLPRHRLQLCRKQQNGALWRFDTAMNSWAATGAVTDKRHNCTLAYDWVHNRVWVSSCAPAENDVSGSGADVNYFRYYDVAGNRWIRQCPTPCGAPGADAGMVVDPIAKKFIAFGGGEVRITRR